MTALRCALALCALNGVTAGSPYPQDPAGVPQDFICAWRNFAAEYTGLLRPDAVAEAMAALQLPELCNSSTPSPRALSGRPVSKLPATAAATGTVYVDGVNGNDANPGTLQAPLRTVMAGIVMARTRPSPAAVLLRAATYYLSETLELTPQDSGLTLSNYDGEEVWISGAAPISSPIAWRPFSVSNASLEVLQGMNNARGCAKNDPDNATCGCATTPTLAACESTFQATLNATAFTWHDPTTKDWALQCCLRHDNVWAPYAEAGHTAGRRSAAQNVYAAAVAVPSTGVPELRVNGVRVPRARYPNANPETDQFPVGWVPSGGETWLPPKTPTLPLVEVNVSNAAILLRNSTQNVDYMGAVGGPCENFEPPFSYWCSAHPSGGGGFQYYVPGGVTLNPPGLLPFSFATPAENRPIFQVWRAAHWANWMFEVESWDNTTGELIFGKGGFQGARGGPGSDWYIENALELLDAPSEWFYDPAAGTLYFFNNGTGAPTADTLFEVPALLTLLRVNASQESPVRNLTISGIGFKDSAPSFMEPHAVPSGGDWALERIAALFFEGTESLVVRNCTVSRAGGNGLMLSGYARDATLADNVFRWTGGTAMAAWGRTDEISANGTLGWDATAGDFPWRTTVTGNLITETGIWEKQSSCWFQAKAAQSTLTGNVCFNLARAGFNFNDGLGGGDEVHSNLIFNSCRESADHGPINSWDRQPYVTLVYDGTPSARMLPRNISNNFLVGNYGGSNGCVDNDDGSLWFDNNHNFATYGHQKFKVGAIRSYGNVLAYVTDFAGHWSAPGDENDRPNGMWGNKVIFAPNTSAVYHDCSAWLAQNNSLYGPDVVVSGSNCAKTYSLPEWQAADPATHDVGCTVNTTRPSPAEIVAWGRALLQGM